MFENNNKNQIMEIFKYRPNFRSKSLYINNKNLKSNNIYNLKIYFNSKNIINNNIKYIQIKNNKNNIKNIQSSIITQNKTDLNKDIKKK